MPRAARAIASLLLAAAATTLAPSPARAYEDQWGLFGGAGYGLLLGDNALPHHGFVLEGGVGVGLGDTFELRVLGGWAFFPATMQRFFGAAEVVYLVDILEVVPFVGLGAGALGTYLDAPTGGALRADFTLHAVVGFDWLLTREIVLGFEARPWIQLTSLDTDPAWLSLTVRVEVLFEM